MTKKTILALRRTSRKGKRKKWNKNNKKCYQYNLHLIFAGPKEKEKGKGTKWNKNNNKTTSVQLLMRGGGDLRRVILRE